MNTASFAALLAALLGVGACAGLLAPSFPGAPAPVCDGDVCVELLPAAYMTRVRVRVRGPAGTRLEDATVTDGEDAPTCASGLGVTRVFVDGVLHRRGPVDIVGRDVTLSFDDGVWEEVPPLQLRLTLVTGTDRRLCLSVPIAGGGEK